MVQQCICLIEPERHVRAVQAMILAGTLYSYNSLYPQVDEADAETRDDSPLANQAVVEARSASANGLYVLRFATIAEAIDFLSTSPARHELGLIVLDVDAPVVYSTEGVPVQPAAPDALTPSDAVTLFHTTVEQLNTLKSLAPDKQPKTLLISADREFVGYCLSSEDLFGILKPYKPDVLVDYVDSILNVNIRF